MRCVFADSILAFRAPSLCPAAPQEKLSDLIAEAKRHNLSHIDVSTPRGNLVIVSSLTDALRSQAALLVQIEQRASVPDPSDSYVWTWYRARIVENLNSFSLPSPILPIGLSVPPELGQLINHSLFIPNTGGI